MFQRVDYKTNLMVGDQTYPAFELRNILDFIAQELGDTAALQVCQHIGVGRIELSHCQFVYVWQVEYAMAYLQAQSGDADIGTKLGLSYRVSSLDLLLPHLRQFDFLQESLQFVVNHPKLVGSFSDTLLCVEEGELRVRWLNTGRIEPVHYGFQFRHSIGSLLGLARELTEKPIELAHIFLAEPARNDAFLTQATGAKIHFNADCYEWRIALNQLELPITYAFPLDTISAKQQHNGSFIDSVLSVIQDSFPKVMNLDDMAASQHMSARSFRRKLAQLGSSYQRLVDQVRCQRAIGLILSNELSIGAIAEMLGYNDVSHFRQSFKHWIGHPPGYFSRLNRLS